MASNLIHQISVYSVLLPLATGIIFYRHQEANAKLMILLLAFASIPQLSAGLIPAGPLKTSFYNLYILADAGLWGCLFLRNIKIPVIKKAILAILFIQLFVTGYFFVSKGVAAHFYSELVCLNSLIQLVWVLFFFYHRYKTEQIERLEHQSMFWFCLGILLYAPSTYFLFAFFPIINKNIQIWTAHDFMNTLMYILFSFGFLVNIIQPIFNKIAPIDG